MKKAAVKIFVVVAMAAAMLINAVVPVGAVETDISYIITKNSDDLSPISEVTLPYDFGTQLGYHMGILLTGNIKSNYTYSIIIQYTAGSTNDAASIDVATLDHILISSLSLSNNDPSQLTDAIILDPNNVVIANTERSGTNITSIITFNTNDLPIGENKSIFLQFSYMNLTINSINLYAVYDSNQLVLNDINNNINNITTEITNLNETISNQTSEIEQIVYNTEQILQIENIINNNINQTNNKLDTVNNNLNTIDNSIQYIANVGDGNKIPNNADDLDTAQQQLHQSEEALTNKSESLASKASSGINTAKTASTQFVSTINPAVTTITGTVTQAIESLPQDIQPMVYSMPLLSFAVWLIGLKR